MGMANGKTMEFALLAENRYGYPENHIDKLATKSRTRTAQRWTEVLIAHNLRNELMHYANDLPDGADLKAEAVAVIEHLAQYMEKDVLLNHSRPLALAYLALTEEVDSVTVTRCKDCKHYDRGECYHPRHEGHLQSICQQEDDYCSYGERKEEI